MQCNVLKLAASIVNKNYTFRWRGIIFCIPRMTHLVFWRFFWEYWTEIRLSYLSWIYSLPSMPPTGCLLQYQLVSNEVISPSSSARNTGILFHSNMSMEPLFTAVAKSAFYHLRNIPVSRIRKYISFHTTEILMHALVTSRLDFCHSLLYGIPQNVLKKLQ